MTVLSWMYLGIQLMQQMSMLCRPDAKNAQYQQTIRHGDLLLNRLQRLSKVVDLE